MTDVAVFGAVWRYAQGDLKKCIAAPKTIGERVGLSHNPVRLALKKLCEAGLLTDLTPEASHKAHEYIPTEKALNLISGINKEAERLPETGNLNEATREERLPETGKQGYQKQVSRLPETGNKERINIDHNRQERETRTHARDYADDLLELQGQPIQDIGPNPEDQYFEYRDEFLSIYQEMTGRYPDQVIKNKVPELVEAGVTPKMWRQSWEECILHWSGNGRVPISRVFEVCNYGGSWEKWHKATYPDNGNGRDSPQSGNGKVEIRTVRATDGGFNL